MPTKVNEYDKMRVIGEGTYGAVYKARNKKTNEWVALKRMLIDDDDEGIPSTTIREISVLKQLKHKNIINLLDIFFHSKTNDIYLVFELASCDLKQFMSKHIKKYPIKLDKIKNYLYQILNGISYCHSKSILHRDIKPQNILINVKTEIIKITDFGLARCYILPNRTWTHEIITLWYRPPEVLLGCKSYSIYVDIWSIGCLFAEMLNNNQPLFRGQSEISQLVKIFMKCGTPNFKNNGWDSVYQDTKQFQNKFPKFERKSIYPHFCNRKDLKKCNGHDLLGRMLILDPPKRITPKQALKHDFFL